MTVYVERQIDQNHKVTMITKKNRAIQARFE